MTQPDRQYGVLSRYYFLSSSSSSGSSRTWTLLEILLLDGVGVEGGSTGLVKFVFRLSSVLLAGGGGLEVTVVLMANDLIKKYKV